VVAGERERESVEKKEDLVSVGKMMLKDLAAIQQQQQQQQHMAADENMSNLTSASGDQASVSSHPLPPPAKKKRSLPGNPGTYHLKFSSQPSIGAIPIHAHR